MTEREIMTNLNHQDPTSRRSLLPRRGPLLASVAAVGLAVAVAVGGASFYLPSTAHAVFPTAQAAEAVPMPQPSGFADLVARVKPAVISVRVQIDQPARTASADQDGGNQAQPGSPMDRFSRQFGFQDGPNGTQQKPQQPRHMAAEGSGFFISADGYAVTNNHVVDHANTVQVITDDGHTLKAKVIGTDPNTDLALIKVDKIDGRDFTFVKFADRDPRIGDWVVAVGNPFGLGGTVTAGVVSARGRDIGSGPYDDFIQIDAPINKGNSGGPAFDVEGNVIGVNTAIFSPSGGSVGIGFDIPADTAKMIVAQLKEHGKVTRGWIGVQIQAVTPDIADSLGMKKVAGALVDEPQAGSPAAKAGIVAGDVITGVDGKDVKGNRELARRIAAMAPGTTVQLAVLHDGAEKSMSLTLGTLPDQRQANADTEQQGNPEGATPRLGLTLAPADQVDGAGTHGVAVTAVDPNGPAAERGVRTGDVILDIGGKAVSKPGDVRQQLSDLRKEGKNTVLLRMKSGNATKFVAVPLGKA
jgi:serine protease Do